MIVDLPVPLAPTSPTRSWAVMSQSAFSNRSLWPKRFPPDESWIMEKNGGQWPVTSDQNNSRESSLRHYAPNKSMELQI
jgi:hypothetical protein